MSSKPLMRRFATQRSEEKRAGTTDAFMVGKPPRYCINRTIDVHHGRKMACINWKPKAEETEQRLTRQAIRGAVYPDFGI